VEAMVFQERLPLSQVSIDFFSNVPGMLIARSQIYLPMAPPVPHRANENEAVLGRSDSRPPLHPPCHLPIKPAFQTATPPRPPM